MIVQALGILGDSDPIVREGGGRWGYFFLALDPELPMPLQEFKKNIQSLQEQVEASRPVPEGAPVRVPGSAATRKVREGKSRGWLEVDEPIYTPSPATPCNSISGRCRNRSPPTHRHIKRSMPTPPKRSTAPRRWRQSQ